MTLDGKHGTFRFAVLLLENNMEKFTATVRLSSGFVTQVDVMAQTLALARQIAEAQYGHANVIGIAPKLR